MHRRPILAAPFLIALPARAQPLWTGRQFHNQPENSQEHRFLLQLWEGVREETGGRLVITVHAQNANIPGSDPGALRMLVAGELEFFTLMGGILGLVVPVMEIQGLPFAFRDHAEVHRVMDGPFGDLLRRECRAQGIVWLPAATLENGFRHISSNRGPVRDADDLRGLRIREQVGSTEGYQITIGGQQGNATTIGKVIGPSFYAEEVPQVIEALINVYIEQRTPSERFIDTFQRIGVVPFKERAYKGRDKRKAASITAGDVAHV